jgi:polysaccharide biosynthesis transport protein
VNKPAPPSSRAWQTITSMRTSEPPDGPSFSQFLGMLRRQSKTISALSLLLFAAAMLVLFQLVPLYRAQALLVVDERQAQLIGIEDQPFSGANLNNRVDTEVEVLSSPSVLLATIDKLSLWQIEEFGLKKPLLDRLLSLFRLSRPDDASEQAPRSFAELTDAQKAQLIETLRRATNVERRGLTSAISIEATSASPELAARIANAIADSYTALQIETRINAVEKAATYLSGRVDDLAKRMKEIDGKITQFIESFQDQIGSPADREEIKRLRTLLAQTATEKSDLAQTISQLQNFDVQNAGKGLPQQVGPEFANLLAERARLSDLQKTAAQPDEFRSQLAALDDRLRDLSRTTVAKLRGEAGKLDERSATVQRQLQDVLGRQTVPPSISVGLFQLQREAEGSRKLYDSYVGRLGELQQQMDLSLPTSRIVSPAISPNRPSFPPTILLIGISLLGALGIGVTAGLAREQLVGGFTSVEQLEAVTGLPTAAAIPEFPERPHEAAATFPLSVYADASRRLRMSIEDALPANRPTFIMVTSTQPSEGKTTIAISLAQTLAIAGRPTLLIDADLRNPSVAAMVGRAAKLGIADWVSEPHPNPEFSDYICSDPRSGLDFVLTPPQLQPNSDLILESASFIQFLREISRAYEFIILDTPPIGHVVDARVLCPMVDLIVFVVGYRQANQSDVMAAIKELRRSTVSPPIMTVLNRSLSGPQGYYGGGYGWQYYRR